VGAKQAVDLLYKADLIYDASNDSQVVDVPNFKL
jgi:hypothetical protein